MFLAQNMGVLSPEKGLNTIKAILSILFIPPALLLAVGQSSAEMIYPMDGGNVRETTTFSWNSAESATLYWLGVGTTQESVSQAPWGDIYSELVSAETTSVEVSGIPTNDLDVYVRL